MRNEVFFLVFLLLFSGVSAVSSEVVLMDDIGSFSGAVMREKSVAGDIGDKIYPSESLIDVGIVKFDLETSASETYLVFLLSKDGISVDSFEVGPFKVNESEIFIDRREKVELDVVKKFEEVGEEIVDEVVGQIDEVTGMVFEEIVSVADENSGEVVENNLSFGGKLGGWISYSKGILMSEDGGVNPQLYFWSAGIFICAGLILFFLVVKPRNKKMKKEVLDGDDKEIAYMEKKVAETEKEICDIESARAKKAKKIEMRDRLSKDEEKLKKLEDEELGDSETIEDVEK